MGRLCCGGVRLGGHIAAGGPSRDVPPSIAGVLVRLKSGLMLMPSLSYPCVGFTQQFALECYPVEYLP